jgi:hypothetical protein
MTEAEFSEWVQRLRLALKLGTGIPHWSQDAQHQDGSFTVSGIDMDRIRIESPRPLYLLEGFLRSSPDLAKLQQGRHPTKEGC